MKRVTREEPSSLYSNIKTNYVLSSPLQEAIYVLHSEVETTGNKAAYNVFRAVSLVGPIEVDLLKKRINQQINIHPILRTGFVGQCNAFVVAPYERDFDAHFNVFNVLKKEDIETIIYQEIQKEFVLSDPPLIRTTLITLGPQEHILLLVSHHCICDDRSLEEIIDCIVSPKEHPNEERNTYSHIVEDLKNKYPQNCEELNFWKDKLGGSLQILQLPTDRVRPSVQGFSCYVESFMLDAGTSDALKKLSEQVCGELGLTIILLTIFKILLHRHTGEEDITVGSPWDTRSRHTNSKSNTTIPGPLEENLVYRTFLSDDYTFMQALGEVEKTVVDANKYKNVSYYRILQVLFPTSNPGHTPLFKTQFSVNHSKFTYTSTDKIRVTPYSLSIASSPYDLRLSVSHCPSSNNLVLSFYYNSELFLPLRIKEMFTQFQLLSQGIVTNPNLRIVSYSLVTPMASQILPSPKEPLDNTWRGPIQDHFAARARENPDRMAIFYEGKTVSYGQLFSLSNKLANVLLSKGISVGDVVGIYGHRSPAVVVAIMGILTSGAAYCMMDPAYPTERVSQCMNIAKPKAWVQIPIPPPDLQAYLNTLSLSLQITLSQPWENCDNLGKIDTYPDVKVNPDAIAVITFTSGSTGIPKGVCGRHIPLTHYYPWMQEEFGITKDDRFSACSGIAHDPLQRDFFTPLFFGAHIFIPTQDDISQPGALAKWFSRHSINISCFTPAIGQILTTGVPDDLKIPSLRLAFFVGDCLLKKDVQLLHALAPNITIINMYGSTETQRSVGYYKVPKDLDSLKEVVIVGKGMRGCQIIILNKNNKLAGIGEVAEIYLRSHHLSQGYIGFPTETEKRFLKNPFTNIEGDRFYRTGDIGRYDLSGNLECVGRADDQIKIRGFRIELGEISAALGKHSTVKENVTIVRQDKPGEKQLASYVVAWPGMSCNAQEIKSFLKAKLPHYMIPTFIIQIPSMPLTPNGKIDRRALPRPSADEMVTDNLTETQKKLTKIWETLLGHSVPSLDSNFFDLGGHSLLVVRVTDQIKKQFKIEISLGDIFNAPTLKELSFFIDNGTRFKSIDYVVESRLPDDIRVRSDILPPSEKIKDVLLTGATGFLGAYLLSEVLSLSEDIHVHCLIRAKDATSAFKRLRENLVNYELWSDSFVNRITAVPGDLSREFLGIDRDLWSTYTSDIDVIIHNGAMVHWLHGYHLLKPINVGGTLEVLKLAATTKLKAVHYVSTTNVFDGDENKKLDLVLEDMVGTDSTGLKGGYTQTKWVAEQLVIKAIRRGIPCKIYRPSYVTGDTTRGIWNSDDFLCRLIKGCIELGVAPKLPGRTLDMSPVDYVARAIVYIALKSNDKKDQFNVVQDELYSYDTWFETVKGYGYKMDMVQYKTWREKLLSADFDHALKPFLSHFTEDWPSVLRGPKYDTTNTRNALSHTDIKNCPMGSVMHLYFSYFVKCGFINPPENPLTDKVIWKSDQSVSLLHRNKNL